VGRPTEAPKKEIIYKEGGTNKNGKTKREPVRGRGTPGEKAAIHLKWACRAYPGRGK